MNKDMCIACDEGILNIRVGAIIMKEGKLLMVGNDRADYLYSVGSRIKFGETAEEAVVREVIAYLLGYQDLNSFFRAFSLWTGKTVTEYKQETS